jgi:hypothetical protein
VAWAKSPATHRAYSQDTVDMAAYHNGLAPAEIHQYAVTDGYSRKTLEYLTWRKSTVVWLDPKHAERVQLPAGKSVITFGTKQQADLARFQAAHPGGTLTNYDRTYNGETHFFIYEVTR